MSNKVTLIVSVRIRGSGKPGVTMEKPYWTKDPSAENARQAILGLRDMGLCEGKIYKVIKSELGNYFVGVF